MGSYLTLRNDLSEEASVLTEQETESGRKPGRKAGGPGTPGEWPRPVAHRLSFYGDAVSFQDVSGQSFELRVLPVGARVTQPGWIPARTLGGW